MWRNSGAGPRYLVCSTAQGQDSHSFGPLAVCDLLATGHDVHFTAERSWAEHRETGDVVNFVRRGGKFEIDVEVQRPNPSGNGSGASFAVSPIEGAVPHREGAQDALQEGEQLRQTQAAAG